jgi:threonine dehydrogenase-like Zn-dependent dehydrogenase
VRKLDPIDGRNWTDWLMGKADGGLALTRSRVRTAYAVAIATDVQQFVLGPFGWAVSDEILDVIALIATTRLLGFHPVLLPTFAVELVPIADMLPTWTGYLFPSLLALSDVMGTGWFAADAANVKPGVTVAVVGDGAVGLLGVLSAKQMGAERIIAMSRHESRQKLAREFGATDIVTERGEEGVARIKELTKGVGADSVLECVGTPESMGQAIGITRPGGSVGYVGVPHGVELDAADLFYRHVRLLGGPAPVRRYLPDLIDRVLNGRMNPGKVFDLVLPLREVAEGYRAMDERRVIKTLLRPQGD